jgi:prepilin-type N-terminal cleavage/methylation domain-containing protein
MRRSKGFTLVELMIVIAVIAILATIGLVGFGRAQKAGRDTDRSQKAKGLQVGLECYYGINGTYPSSLDFTDLDTSLTTECWTGNELGDPVAGATFTAAGAVQKGTTTIATYTYTSAAPNDSYTITLTGESGRTYTFESPQ